MYGDILDSEVLKPSRILQGTSPLLESYFLGIAENQHDSSTKDGALKQSDADMIFLPFLIPVFLQHITNELRLVYAS